MSDIDPLFKRAKDLQEIEPYSGFLAFCKSPHTKANYHQDLRVLKLFLDTSGIVGPAAVKPQDLARFVGHLTKPGLTPAQKPRPAYSTRSMKRILASTRSFYRYLASVQLISSDPTAVFYNLTIRSPQRNPRPLGSADREKMIQALRSDELDHLKISLVVLLGYHCGLRVSEISQLAVSEINMGQKILTVIGKSDKQRSVPMSDILQSWLKNYLERRGNSERPSPFVFQSPRSPQRPINPHFLELWVKEAAKWAGLESPEELSVHVLRHTFGTQLAESGASVYEIRDLMGHSSIVVSENYVKLASNKGRLAHQKAFGAGARVHALNFGKPSGVEYVLKRYRASQRREAGMDRD